MKPDPERVASAAPVCGVKTVNNRQTRIGTLAEVRNVNNHK